MKFSKAYIKECDCELVQGLKNKLEYGDWVTSDLAELENALNDKFLVLRSEGKEWGEVEGFYREDYIWLPTGDQLDREIVKVFRKITSKKQDYFYTYAVSFIDGEVSQWEISYQDRDYKSGFLEDDIKLAKIQLLKHLLEAE